MNTAIVVTAVASAALGGVFFAFSSFIMPALDRIAPAEAMRAMQRINVDVLCRSFFALFFGVPILSLGLTVHAGLAWSEPGSALLLTAGLLNILGSFVVTVVGNVPLNERLAKQSADSANASTLWSTYSKPWVRWNSLRASANLAAAVLLLAAA